MLRNVLWISLTFVLQCGVCQAFEVNAIIRKADAEQRVLMVFANGQERTVDVSADAQFQDEKKQPLANKLRAPELKAGAEVTLSVEQGANKRPHIVALRLGHHAGGRPGRGEVPPGGGQYTSKPMVGLKPLTEMSADDRYKGEDGGLYGGGQNTPPAALAAAAKQATAQIVPRDASGKPAPDGKIALISISMSNATQEFSRFKQVADADQTKSPLLTIVDCAQGGQAMAEWATADANPWREAKRRLEQAYISPEQVQVAWIKLANKGPRGELSDHGRKLQKDTLAVIQIAKQNFPNLQIAYLGSRIYAGYATSGLNPEPYAYEGAFPVRWLIQDQMKGDAQLNPDASRGPVKAPLLLWGPYFWADGTTPRKADNLHWDRADLAGDGTHPSDSGRQKVAEQLRDFFVNDPFASGWFVKK